MSSGRCLCGSVTWEISGKPKAAYHCHCSMCRKAHGAAFGTYYFMPTDNFYWTSKQDTVVNHRSSPGLPRAFCGTCGSVVPNYDVEGQHVYVPAGCHDEGVNADSHIFVGSKAPWYDITDDLPQHEVFPPGEDYPVYEGRALDDAPEGVVRGSCLCGAVEFEVLQPFKVVHNCHCSRCRRARAAAHTTNGFISMEGVRFVKGEDHVTSYKLPTAKYFTHVFCDVCGSGLPRLDPERNIAVVPLGVLDDDPGRKPVDNIFVASKAGWYEITDDLPAYDEAPSR